MDKINDKIDFVITWVDGNDPEWQKQKDKYREKITNEKSNNKIDDRKERYRDIDCLKYWFRGIEKFAPWVNKIYFITCGQKPEWLNEKNPKIVLINHSDYMDKQDLPTFNSDAIECKMHKIKGLSEKFVYFNDDVFIVNKVYKQDFFKNNKPCDSMVLKPIEISGNNTFHRKNIINIELINKYFNYSNFKKNNFSKIISLKQGKHIFKSLSAMGNKTFVGFRNSHICIPYLKSTFKEVWKKEPDYLNYVSSCKFRKDDYGNHWLFEYWQFATGNFDQRKVNFGKFLKMGEKEVSKCIEGKKYKILCINDNYNLDNFDEIKNNIIKSFEKKFPKKSSFEK